MPHLPPRPTRLRANPMHRWGTVRVVRQYRYRTSPIPPSLGLVQGQLPVWSKWGLKRKIRIVIYFLSTKGKLFVTYKDNPHLQRSTDSLPSFGKQKGHRDHSLPQLLKSQTEPLNKRQRIRLCAFLCSSSRLQKILALTWERGSSSELGKSYWFRSLALKTGSVVGLACWGAAAADEGKTLGFFSYLRLGRIRSALSCCNSHELNTRNHGQQTQSLGEVLK